MKDPSHPGEIIRELYIEPLGLTVTQAAAALGVTRKTLSLLLNGHAGISPEMAVRLSQAFGRTPESWLQLQWSTTWQGSGRERTLPLSRSWQARPQRRHWRKVVRQPKDVDMV